MQFNIHRIGQDPVVGYAATELEKYLQRALVGDVAVSAYDVYDPQKDGIWLGTCDAFEGVFSDPGLSNPLDDAILLKSESDNRLLISGANARSVLFAVYTYLEGLGLGWVRMGRDGEVIPRSVDLRLGGYNVQEQASYRYRGVCIEGGVSIEHAVDMVDYMAKKRFNTYFIQFQNAYMFWSRWYDRRNSVRSLAEEQADRYTARLISEIKRRGLALQMVGHGWVNECLGVKAGGWMTTTEELPPEKKELLAEVDGQRGWWKGIPMATELCLSNPKAFDTLVDYIVRYAESHPEVDMLHVWMSDGWNNRCECPECSKKLPSDWYVDVLNALDERMTAKGIDTKVVFLAYADLLWAPSQARIKNPSRFIIMFAPLTRLFRNALLENPAVNEEPMPYRRNQNVFPKSTSVNVHYLHEWQNMFAGDGFTFDYHLVRKHSIVEPTGLAIAEVLHKDILGTEQLRLQGMVNCQVQRYFFPTGLAMEVSGRALWNKAISFADIKKDYFTAAFGADGADIQRRLETLSGLMDADALFGLEPVPSELYQRALREAEGVLDEAEQFVAHRLGKASWLDDARIASFHYLHHGLEFARILLSGFQRLAGGEHEGLSAAYAQAGIYLTEHEDELHEVCDCARWKQWLDSYAREGRGVASGGPDV